MKTSRLILTGALTGLLAAAGGAARAQVAVDPAGASDVAAPGPWQLGLGVRDSAFADAGFDPFSTSDAFVQVSLSAMRTFDAGGRLTPALGLIFERGSTDALARSADAELTLSRLAVAAEERLALHRRLWATARLSAGVLLGAVSLRDDSAPAPLSTTFARPTVDGSLGLTALLVTIGRATFLAAAEGGYGWSPRQPLSLAPDLPAGDRDKAGATSLGSFAARGPFFRLTLSLAF